MGAEAALAPPADLGLEAVLDLGLLMVAVPWADFIAASGVKWWKGGVKELEIIARGWADVSCEYGTGRRGPLSASLVR